MQKKKSERKRTRSKLETNLQRSSVKNDKRENTKTRMKEDSEERTKEEERAKKLMAESIQALNTKVRCKSNAKC